MKDKGNLIEYLLARLGENSTWRGVILLITGVGVNVNHEQSHVIISVGLALVGIINVFRKGKRDDRQEIGKEHFDSASKSSGSF